MIEQSSIRVSKQLRKQLNKMKTHPRESYDQAIKRYIAEKERREEALRNEAYEKGYSAGNEAAITATKEVL